MIKTTCLVVTFVAFITAEKASFENFKVFRIIPKNDEQLNMLKEFENYEGSFEFWRGPSFVDKPVDLMVAPSKIAEFDEFLKNNQFYYNLFISNVQNLIENENLSSIADDDSKNSYDFKSYKTLDQIYTWMESLAVNYSQVEIIVVGKTFENRDIKGVKISHGKNKPGVFIEAGIHAREWIAPATATYIINALITSSDIDVRSLAESYDWYIVPSVNPDGYVYTHKSNRLWRKTRSQNKKSSCRGTDPNRNWDFEWMTAGSSSNPCSESYGGPKPFSEIETKTLSDYIKSIKDKLFAYISFHSYSQLLMHPYGHTYKHLENYADLYAIAKRSTQALAKRYGTSYNFGGIAETIYMASGNSIDWAKETKIVQVSFTYEFRDTGSHGFILPANQIIPNSEEVLDSLVAMFKEAKRIGYPKPQK